MIFRGGSQVGGGKNLSIQMCPEGGRAKGCGDYPGQRGIGGVFYRKELSPLSGLEKNLN